ncbi:REP-associated tyrosine transposase [Colwellia ponticola]|uniref:Transposase n=1 Tax=Colwellia ponticola TaxID=2304625 RepID=A0A8H2JML1_9GAMM|nr:transposase [Colwellia ponticola]TMM46397.1 transposase [Colwellia ponticola]
MSWSELRKGRISQAQGEYFITFNSYNKRPYFNNFDLACLFCQYISVHETKYQCTWLTWVLMPDHFHGLLRLNVNDPGLSQVVGALRGASSFIITKKLNGDNKLWQPSFYDRALRIEDDRKNIARYIIANPLRKKLVNHIGDYPFWNSIYL